MIVSRRDVARSLIDAREILETYRSYGLVVDGWRQSLEVSARTLAETAPSYDEVPGIDVLRRELWAVVDRGLDADDALVARAADRLAHLASQMVVPGVPRPQDADWAFGAQSDPG